jgi:hypothetical protein
MSVIQLTVSCTVSLVQLTVQCFIQTMCCGFEFVLEFVTLNLLLQCVCHSVDCQLYCQFGSAKYSAVYRLSVVAFNLYYSL